MGRVTAVSGSPGDLRTFHLALLRETLRSSRQPAIFLDGAHVLNPYEWAEHNFSLGEEGEDGVDRIMTCRAMTPFQWCKMLTTELQDNLALHRPSLVVAGHFDTQLNKDDLKDWEQEDCIASVLRQMRRLAHFHGIPIVLTVDLARWTRTHPTAAQLFMRGVSALRRVEATPRGWALYDERDVPLVQPAARNTLDAFLEPALEPVVVTR